jgi:hypothetical protein
VTPPPPEPHRDRDAAGRPHNTRPRDRLGRPLPYGATGVERAPEGTRRSPDETIAQAQRLLDEGLAFHAHEVFEDAWKSGPAGERALWRGLAQLAVGITHALRGNRTGAFALLRRAANGIEPYTTDRPYGLDIAGLTHWARHSADDLDAGATALPTPPRLRQP